MAAHGQPAPRAGRGRERGQSTVEWLGLVLLVALGALALLAGGVRLPGLAVVEGLGAKLVCLAGIEAGACAGGGSEPLLLRAYGPEVAGQVVANAPRIEYEAGMRAVPVDFRRCRRDPCSLGVERGPVVTTLRGEPVTLFVHAVDCRPGGAAVPMRRYECSASPGGHLYVQYWAYYPGSQSLRGLPGNPGFHPDDWESFQVRLGDGAPLARASSHQGYNYSGGAASWPSDTGLVSRPAWGPSEGRYYVSGGSHAGHVHEDAGARVLLAGAGTGSAAAARLRAVLRRAERFTPPGDIRLIPLEPLARRGRRWRFAVTPPWRKRVYRDPEWEGTD